MKSRRLLALAVLSFASPLLHAADLEILATNRLDVPRPAETIELSLAQLAPLGTNLLTFQVLDAAAQPILCQAVDTDFDAFHRPDILIFQADFAPGEARRFTVRSGKKQVYKPADFKAYGRFNRERFDDFVWENDRVAHRMYGQALETWAGEPLTSSTVDVWLKRVTRMVVDSWYMADDYHSDTGEGADFYSAGPSRGCGGNGLWADNHLWVSRNFIDSRTLARGPIRVCFELVYPPFKAGSADVSEVKRITLDAGSHFSKFQSFYRVLSGTLPPLSGVGLKKSKDQEFRPNPAAGWIALWEKVAKNNGSQGLAVLAAPKSVKEVTSDSLNHLLLLTCAPDSTVEYRAGSCWDKAGQFTSFEAWQQHLDLTARLLQSPIQVTVTSR